MYKGLEKVVNKLSDLRLILPIFLLTCFLAYGLSLDMYFWKDDFALMIKAQHPEEPVGFFGPGMKGEGAYRYIAIPFALLYPYFGLNATSYFFVGILLYFVATLGVFILALEIFEDRFKAFLTGLIFSSGFIGADSIFGLTNSYQTSWVILFLSLSLTFFLKSFKDKNLYSYILSVFIFALTLETGYIRAHGFFLVIISVLFLLLEKTTFKRTLEFLLKIIPFFLIFKTLYLNSASAKTGFSQFSTSFNSGGYKYFFNPLVTFVNVFIPTSLIQGVWELMNKLLEKNASLLKYQLGLFTIFILLLLILVSFLFFGKKLSQKYPENRKNLRILFFSLCSILGSFIGVFFISAATTSLESTHRYLSTALIGLSFFWVSLFSLLLSFKKNKTLKYRLLIPVLVICLIYLSFGNLYELEVINLRTNTQKEFFSQLKKEIPVISKTTFVYFDVSNKNNSNGKFGNIFGAGSVGGSPEITMHYPGVDRYSVVTSSNDFQDFVQKYKEGKGEINNTFWFHFENDQLINKTAEVRNILEKGKNTIINFDRNIMHETKLIEKDGKFFPNSTTMEFNFPQILPTMTDGILKFKLSIEPSEISIKQNAENKDSQIYLQYLLSKSKIKKSSKAKVFNNFQNQVAQNLFDGKNETNWMADRGPWHNLTHGETKDIQFIEVSLDNPINLGGILFTNGNSMRTLTSYRIMVRENNEWKEIKKTEFKNAKDSNEIWFDKVNPVFTDQVRLELFNTSSTDAPQLAELELVEDQFSNIDFKKAQQIELNPSLLLEENPESPLVKEYFEKNGEISFSYLSDKDNDFNVPDINFKVKGLGSGYSYEIPILANGTHLVKAKFFNLSFPAKYIFSDFEFINPPLSYYLNKQ